MRTVRATLTLLLAMAAPAGAAEAGRTLLVSGPSNAFAPLLTPIGEAFNTGDAITEAGRWVVFSSRSDGLSDADDDGVRNAYVRDMQTGALTLLNSTSSGEPGHGDTAQVAIEDDESNAPRVAFVTEAGLVGEDDDGDEDVYVRDLATNSVRMVSRATGPNGASPPGDVTGVSIDSAGAVVAWSTRAALDPADVGDSSDVYSRDLAADVTQWESQREIGGGPTSVSPGVPANADQPSLSPDGGVVVFGSTATDLDSAAVDTNGVSDTFARTRGTGNTTIVSVPDGSATTAGTGGGARGQLVRGTGPGYVVVFGSDHTNLVADDTDGSTDAFRRVLGSTATEMISLNDDDEQTEAQVFVADVDGAGNRILMRPFGTDMIDPDLNEGDVDILMRTRTGPGLGSTTLVSRGDGATGAQPSEESNGGSISSDGNWLAYSTAASELALGARQGRPQVLRRQLVGTQLNQPVSFGPDSATVNPGGESRVAGRRAVSADGRYVLFTSPGGDISPDDAPGDADIEIYRRDMLTGETVLVSREDGAGAVISAPFISGAISDDGNRSVFIDPVGPRVLVRDIAAQTTTLVNTGTGGELDTLTYPSDATISGDGGRVAYLSHADLSGTGEVSGRDVFVRELATGAVRLASRGDGDGPDGDGDSATPALSHDGQRVAFVADAANLGDGDADTQPDVHLRDLEAGTTVLVNRSTSGQKSDAEAARPSISADGARVLFLSSATNLDPAASGAADAVFLRDVGAQTTTLVSRDGPGGSQLPGSSFDPSLASDGTVAAWRQSPYTPTGGSEGPAQALVRALDGPVQVAGRADGSDGVLVDDTVGGVAINADGSCVAFHTSARNVIAAPMPGDVATTWLRVFRNGCPELPVDQPPPGGTPGPNADTTPPVISGLRLTRRRFRARQGTAARFRLSEDATVRLRAAQRLRGRRAGGKCRKPRPALRKRKRCTRFAGRATLTRSGVKAGAVRIRFRRRTLRRGRYRLTAGATDAAGNAARPRRVAFRIVKR